MLALPLSSALALALCLVGRPFVASLLCIVCTLVCVARTPPSPFLPSNALREAFSSDMATYTATCFEGVIESREHQEAHLNQLLGLLLRACPLTCLVIHSRTHHHRHPSLPPAERKSERGFRKRCSALASSSATCKMVRVCPPASPRPSRSPPLLAPFLLL